MIPSVSARPLNPVYHFLVLTSGVHSFILRLCLYSISCVLLVTYLTYHYETRLVMVKFG